MADESTTVTGEPCPFCHEKALSMTEMRREVPYFGVCYLFSMDCTNCKYHKADIEAEEKHEPVRFDFEAKSEDDLKVRVVKSSNATVKLGTIGSIEPGEAANGYLTNVEGLLKRLQHRIESLKEAAKEEGDDATVKKAKGHLKRLTRILWGQEPIKITLTDPSGNSAIISEAAVKKRL